MIVDIHTHSFCPSEFQSILNLSFQDAATILSSSEKGLFSVGIHPWNAHKTSENEFSDLRKWAADKRVFAIGECGLDNNSTATLPTQLLIFKKQIELSEQFQKPLIIHCVGSFNELFNLKKEIKPTQVWIIHGFRGKAQLASQALKNNCALSFGEHFNEESVRATHIDKLFVETDESTLTIDSIYKKIAIIKGINVREIVAGSKLLEQIASRPSQI